MTARLRPAEVWAGLQRWPGWALALAIYALARLFTATVTLWAAHHEPANLWTPASPGYGDFVSMWDGDRYRRIAEAGYPVPFPVDERGQPEQSEWAFFPAYPLLVRLLWLLGVPFELGAPTLSLLLGAAATCYAYALFSRHCDRGAALAGVALFSCFPTAPVMQYAYSESTCLLGLLGTLYYLDRRQHLAAIPFAVLLGLSRPIGLALLPVIGLHLLVGARRLLIARSRAGGPTPAPTQAWTVGQLGSGLLLLVAAGAAALTFPAIVGLISGRPDGYTAVQVAWRVSDRMEYFTPWVWMSRYALGEAGPFVLAVAVAAMVVLLASTPVLRLGRTMWSWCLAYTAYLAAVLDPFTSLPRFLLLYVPLAAAAANAFPPGRRRRAVVAVLLVVFLVLQVWWIGSLWFFTPPSDYPP